MNLCKIDFEAEYRYEQFVQSHRVQVRQEKATGCYPWTHLTHNEDEEVAVETELY